MDFPPHIDTLSMGLPILSFKGSKVELRSYDIFLSLKVVLILANNADLHFIWVFTVCQSTHLGVPSIQRDKLENPNLAVLFIKLLKKQLFV